MSEELVNHYKPDERDILFLLFEQFRIQDYLGKAPYAEFGEDDARMIITEAIKFTTREVGTLNSYADRVGCKHDPQAGTVTVPPLMKELQKKYEENGWHLLRAPEEWGGQAAPHAVSLAVSEFFSGACAAWAMYTGLTLGSAKLIHTFGTDEQRSLYCPKMYSGEWMGTMCLTEPAAGSEVGRNAATAVKNDDGTYKITGTKIFISGGDHDMTDNIIHLVLARIEGAARGTKGLSLFIVPKMNINGDGSLGETNDVICRGIESKMGIKASATATLNFGDNEACTGFLLGAEEHKGISQMFQMMNEARIGTGMQALSQASSAYLNAVGYARERVQGKPFADIATGKRGESVTIIHHEDVRRMLLEMKCKVEGMRALALKLAAHGDRAAVAGEGTEVASKELGYVELLTPLVKAYLSDQGFRVAELAIQVYGGYGYIKDYPVEQYCRDIKIQSLYEGTNYIQSLDLVGRKLNQDGGALVRQLAEDITRLVKEHEADEVFGSDAKALGEALGHMTATTMQFMKFFQEGQHQLIPLAATRFLEMMAEVTCAYLLLEGAVIAHEKMQDLAETDRDYSFYAGKIHSARFFIRNILPGVKMKAEVIASRDKTAIDIEDHHFPMVGAD